jgi:hypothetical protein
MVVVTEFLEREGSGIEGQRKREGEIYFFNLIFHFFNLKKKII